MSEQAVDAAVAGAVTAAEPAWAQALAVIVAVGLPIVLSAIAAYLNTPKTATVAEADPAVEKQAMDALAAYDASGR